MVCQVMRLCRSNGRPEPSQPSPVTPAQQSTGPKTEEGKRRSSLNVLRHGFCSHVVVMPYEDLEAFKAFEARCHKMYAPIGDLEKEATQSCAELRWRMRRVGALESSIFTLGHEANADKFNLGDGENTQPIQTGLAAAFTFKMDADIILKLSLWEQRLLKQFQSAEARLFRLQAERRARFELEKHDIITIRKVHKQQNRPFCPGQFGFVSTLPKSKDISAKPAPWRAVFRPNSIPKTRSMDKIQRAKPAP